MNPCSPPKANTRAASRRGWCCWILDNRPKRNRAQFFQLGVDSRYHQVEADEQGIYHARELPGLWVNIHWFWQDAPDALRAIAQVIGPERVAEALRKAAE